MKICDNCEFYIAHNDFIKANKEQLKDLKQENAELRKQNEELESQNEKLRLDIEHQTAYESKQSNEYTISELIKANKSMVKQNEELKFYCQKHMDKATEFNLKNDKLKHEITELKANGIFPKFKLGDTVYIEYKKEIKRVGISEIKYHKSFHGWSLKYIVETGSFKKEVWECHIGIPAEAEQVLEEMSK